jgi:hypothetical protein
MATFQLMLPTGQLVRRLFWLAAVSIGLLGVVSPFTTATPVAGRDRPGHRGRCRRGGASDDPQAGVRIDIRPVLAGARADLRSRGRNLQIAHILPEVWGRGAGVGRGVVAWVVTADRVAWASLDHVRRSLRPLRR